MRLLGELGETFLVVVCPNRLEPVGAKIHNCHFPDGADSMRLAPVSRTLVEIIRNLIPVDSGHATHSRAPAGCTAPNCMSWPKKQLRWSDVDFDSGKITIAQGRVVVAGQGTVTLPR